MCSSEMKEINEFNVWIYYKVVIGNNENVTCIQCGKLLKCKGGSTSDMLRHLKEIHGIDKKTITILTMTLVTKTHYLV